MLNTSCNLSLSMLFAGYTRVESWWNFQNIISPFYRLYYIKDGHAKVYLNNKCYELSANQLFLIPKFTFHSYECDDFMSHYYICLFDDLTGGSSILNPSTLNLQLPATSIDMELIQRYMDLNPHKSLTAVDPQQYDNEKIVYTKTRTSSSPYSQIIESNGILLQLFSRFVTEESMKRTTSGNSYERLDIVIQHINKNLDQHISILELSGLMCITPDHFSKIFKRVIGIPPCEYIQMKRIERAQALLLTSRKSITEIGEQVGIYNSAQFSRLFTKTVQCSPREYRKMQQINEAQKREPIT